LLASGHQYREGKNNTRPLLAVLRITNLQRPAQQLHSDCADPYGMRTVNEERAVHIHGDCAGQQRARRRNTNEQAQNADNPVAGLFSAQETDRP
jgi:hypothetical protein